MGLAIGGLVGARYKLVSFIAAGGMGEVWEAQDEFLQHPCVIKLLRSEYTGNMDDVARFKREARATADLKHPGIVPVHNYGVHEGREFLVMEFVPGRALSSVIKSEGSLGVARSLFYLVQLSNALDAAHSSGLVHRDIKPGNILITPSDSAKITDFGIALRAGQQPLTQTGKVVGTYQYISPEQAMGQSATVLSDIYSLGIVAYECLAGRPPFLGESPVAVAISHMNDAPPPLPANIPVDVRELVMSMLSKDPSKRPESAAAIEDAVEGMVRVQTERLNRHEEPLAPTIPFDQPGARKHSAKVSKTPIPDPLPNTSTKKPRNIYALSNWVLGVIYTVVGTAAAWVIGYAIGSFW